MSVSRSAASTPLPQVVVLLHRLLQVGPELNPGNKSISQALFVVAAAPAAAPAAASGGMEEFLVSVPVMGESITEGQLAEITKGGSKTS
jgi:hypothetical protein